MTAPAPETSPPDLDPSTEGGYEGGIPETLRTWAGPTWRVLVILAGFGVLILLMGQISIVLIALFLAAFFTALASPIMRFLQTKAKLHSINSNLLGVIREMEEAGDEMVKVIQQAEEAGGGFWMIHQLKRLLGLATRWMDAKERVADIAVVNSATTEPVELGQ